MVIKLITARHTQNLSLQSFHFYSFEKYVSLLV